MSVDTQSPTTKVYISKAHLNETWIRVLHQKKKKRLKIEKTNITERCASFFRTVVLLKMQSSQQLYAWPPANTAQRENGGSEKQIQE